VVKAERHKKIGVQVVWQAGGIIVLAAIVGLLVNQIRPERLPLAADWTPEARLTLESGENIAISLDKTKEVFLSKEGVFLDARSPELYEQGHIRGARNLPWQALENHFDSVMADIPKDRLIISYCDGEACALSKDLAIELLFRGYENVRVLINGWSVWQENQLPVAKGSHPGRP
jgi:rhodanese-related sulfurtransferase